MTTAQTTVTPSGPPIPKRMSEGLGLNIGECSVYIGEMRKVFGTTTRKVSSQNKASKVHKFAVLTIVFAGKVGQWGEVHCGNICT